MATRAACYAGYAFLLLANILSYHATTAFASVPSFDDGTYMPVLGATHAAAFVAVALRYRNVAHEPLGSKAAGFAAVALCIGFALVLGSCSVGMQPGFVAGTVLIGVGQAVLSLLWLSALKPTTRSWHASRHGKVYTTEEVRDFYAENGNRYNCYCSQIPVLLNDDGSIFNQGLAEKLAKERQQWTAKEAA